MDMCFLKTFHNLDLTIFAGYNSNINNWPFIMDAKITQISEYLTAADVASVIGFTPLHW